MGVFFLQVYQTALFDEWLHRPVVKDFVTNGDFPFVNPYKPDSNFMNSYHYGLYIPASSIQLLTGVTVPEALDVLKFSFAIASLFLIYGLVFAFSDRRKYAAFAAVLILFCGGSFFFWDGFTLNHLRIWGEPKISFNTPVLYLMAGITWVNIIITLAFICLIEGAFFRRTLFDFKRILLFIFLMVGLYLISELFAALVLLFFGISILYSYFTKKLSWQKMLPVAAGSLFGLLGLIMFFGGVADGLIESSERAKSFSDILTLKPLSEWGYPTTTSGSLSFSSWWLVYLRNYFLEIILFAILGYGLLSKKISFRDSPLLWAALFICMFIPFAFSSSFGDVNLSKFKDLWPVILYLIFFYYVAVIDYNKKILKPVLILFFIGSVPLLVVNASIQWKDSGKSAQLRCRENNLCYDTRIKEGLRSFEAANPGKKRFLAANQGEAQQIIDITNSYAIASGRNITLKWLKTKKIDFIYETSGLRNKLSKEANDLLNDHTQVIFENEIFKIRSTGELIEKYKREAEILGNFEKEHPGGKTFLAANGDEKWQLENETNSKAVIAPEEISREWLEEKGIDFVYYTDAMKEKLSESSKNLIWSNMQPAYSGDAFGIFQLEL
ncbi:MAG: hypothetical protein U5L10_04465 [Candidatus Moranbacteria bacterium]|nr:hypothetical protein [Candidatus Moranbacteria bacterium]